MEFDGWKVDRVSGEISRGGRAARLPQQPLRILIELFDHAGAVVTRDQLVKVLWPAGIVDFDNGLNVAMRKLRVALDDVGDTPRYIETLPRVGYRFIGRPGCTAASDAVAATRRCHSPALPSSWRSSRSPLAWGCHGGCGPGGILRGTFPANARRSCTWKVCSCARAATSTPPSSRSKSSRRHCSEDPEYAEAWAAYGKGDLDRGHPAELQTPAEGMPKARAAVERAIELDPNPRRGLRSAGPDLMDHDKEFAAAKREFDRSMQLNDHESLVWHHLAMWHGHLGHLDEAFAAIRRARELEPTRPVFA